MWGSMSQNFDIGPSVLLMKCTKFILKKMTKNDPSYECMCLNVAQRPETPYLSLSHTEQLNGGRSTQYFHP